MLEENGKGEEGVPNSDWLHLSVPTEGPQFDFDEGPMGDPSVPTESGNPRAADEEVSIGILVPQSLGEANHLGNLGLGASRPARIPRTLFPKPRARSSPSDQGADFEEFLNI